MYKLSIYTIICLVAVILSPIQAQQHSKMYQQLTNKTNIDKLSTDFIHFSIQKWTSKNGIKVLFVQENTLPMINITINLNAGSIMSDKSGVAFLTAAMLEEGTNKYNVEQIANKFESLGSIFATKVQHDNTKIYLQSLSDNKHLTPSLKLLNNILSSPSFPQHNFQRVQQNLINNLIEESQHPESIVNRNFYAQVYGNNPYGRPIQGTVASVKSINCQEVKNFYREYYNNKNAIITLVGNLTLNKAKKIANQISQHIAVANSKQTIAKEMGEIDIPHKNVIIKNINFPTKQTHIIIGNTAIRHDNPDYPVLYLGNAILGGASLNSILFKNIRIENGLAYSVNSILKTMKYSGVFFINLQTRNQQANKALTMTKKILTQFLTIGPSKKQVVNEKRSLLNNLSLRITSNASISRYLNIIGFYNLPADYINTLGNKIKYINYKQIAPIMRKYIQPQNMVQITVGNLKIAKV